MLRVVLVFLLGMSLGVVLFPLAMNWTAGPPSTSMPEPASSVAVAAEVSLPRSVGAELTLSRQNAIVRAVEKVAPSVVSVNTSYLKDVPVRYRDPFFELFFPFGGFVREKTPGIGSGFVFREDGYILTNSHVVEGAHELAVTFPDGQRYEVVDVRRDVLIDRQMDLAVIHIDADGLPALGMGNSDDAITGEWAIAIGNPFGLTIEDPQPTVTVGVVSAIARNIQSDDGRTYHSMIQTDASINPGNSGGPLVNSAGEVIGVNTLIFSKSGGSLGIGFAIPIARAAEVARELIERGTSGDFWTGITVHNLNRQIARALGLATSSGALVVRVEADSPGTRAEINPGDVIVAVNDGRVRNADVVVEAFHGSRVGDVFVLKILRGQRLLQTQLVLERAPLSQ